MATAKVAADQTLHYATARPTSAAGTTAAVRRRPTAVASLHGAPTQLDRSCGVGGGAWRGQWWQPVRAVCMPSPSPSPSHHSSRGPRRGEREAHRGYSHFPRRRIVTLVDICDLLRNLHAPAAQREVQSDNLYSRYRVIHHGMTWHARRVAPHSTLGTRVQDSQASSHHPSSHHTISKSLPFVSRLTGMVHALFRRAGASMFVVSAPSACPRARPRGLCSLSLALCRAIVRLPLSLSR